MVQNQNETDKRGINNLHFEAKRSENVMVSFTPFEIEYIKSFTNLLSHMVAPYTGKPIITENTPVALIRFCISYMSAIYQTQIFPNSRVINMFSNKHTKKEFIAFRAKYMNMPSDLQLQDLKRLGLVRHKA